MFLIDSSAWIEYLRPEGSPMVKNRVRDILQKEEAVSCGIVVVEVLRGARSTEEFQALRESLTSLPQIPIDEGVIQRAAEWGFILERKGKSVPTTDLFIASASYKNARIVHLNSDFKAIASECDIDEEEL